MRSTIKSNVHVMLGTHKGAFILWSNRERADWTLYGPYLKGVPVEYVMATSGKSLTLFASVTNPYVGPQIHYSKDVGQTWKEVNQCPRFSENRGLTLERIWVIEQSCHDTPTTLYAGVEPAALFVSHDGGMHWEEMTTLTDHPTRKHWFPGKGGLCLHSIVLDPSNRGRMWVAISAAGVFFTEDGGQTWEPRNRGIRAEFLPDHYPAVGQCVHKLVSHQTRPDRLFVQNHGGIYRTDDKGQLWKTIETGLPAVFGFPILTHPHNPDIVYIIPLVSAEERYVPNGQLSVYRSKDAGKSWSRLGQGLPHSQAWLTVFRQALAADTLDPCGIYLGTSTGQVYGSRDSGDSWKMIADHLPPILSLRVCTS